MDLKIIKASKDDIIKFSNANLRLLAKNLNINNNLPKQDIAWLIAIKLIGKYQHAAMSTGYIEEPRPREEPEAVHGGYLEEEAEAGYGGYLTEGPEAGYGGYLTEGPEAEYGGYLAEGPEEGHGGYLAEEGASGFHLEEPEAKPCILDDIIPDTIHMSCENFSKRYLYKGPLGTGAFGSVGKYYDKKGDQLMALKMIEYTPRVAKRVYVNEFKVLQELRASEEACSKYVMCYREHFILDDCNDKPCTLVIVMEYIAGNSIYQLLKEHKEFTPKELVRILCGILKGLYFLHQHNIVHRDLHSGNVMIRNNGSVVLVDFGQSCKPVADCMGSGLINLYTTRPEYYIEKFMYNNPLTAKILKDNDVYAVLLLMYQMMRKDTDTPFTNVVNLAKRYYFNKDITTHEFISELSKFKFTDDPAMLYPQDPKFAERILDFLNSKEVPSIRELLNLFC